MLWPHIRHNQAITIRIIVTIVITIEKQKTKKQKRQL